MDVLIIEPQCQTFKSTEKTVNWISTVHKWSAWCRWLHRSDQDRKVWEVLFPLEIMFLIRELGLWSKYSLYRRCWKSFFPLLSSHFFPLHSTVVQNRWHHHLCFFRLVRLDLLMKWSLYAILPMQMCGCGYFSQCSFHLTGWSNPPPEVSSVWMLGLYLAALLHEGQHKLYMDKVNVERVRASYCRISTHTRVSLQLEVLGAHVVVYTHYSNGVYLTDRQTDANNFLITAHSVKIMACYLHSFLVVICISV